MNWQSERVIKILADGRIRSCVQLGAQLGLSSDGIDGVLHELEDVGLRVERVAGRGCRLSRPLFSLDAANILSRLDDSVSARIEQLELHGVVESTSNTLTRRPAPQAGHANVCLAEFQTGGRARRGRRWIAPFGAGVCLSLSWTFDARPGQLGTLSLATGVVAIEALARLGVPGLTLKWPNDIVVGSAKLGGILIDVALDGSGRTHIVLGIGLNYSLPAEAPQDIAALGGSAVDICSLMPAGAPGRNLIAATLIGDFVGMLTAFTHKGFEPWRAGWRAVDCLNGHDVRVFGAGRDVDGRACGITDDGALQVQTQSGIECFVSGEVSVRQRRAAAH